MLFLRSLYHMLIPQSVRRRLYFPVTKYRECRLKYIKKRMGSEKRRQQQLAELRSILRERPLRIAFQVAQLGKWKADSVLQLMQMDSRFAPVIWIMHFSGDAELRARDTAPVRQYFEAKGIPCVEYHNMAAFPDDERPDLVFLLEPYDSFFNRMITLGLLTERLAYLPYCFHNTVLEKSHDGIGGNAALFCFYENEYMCHLTASMKQNRGRNNIPSGNPIADMFLSEDARTQPVWKDCGKPMKKVIWAPHWTITPGSSWFVSGTFLTNAQAITELAVQYADSIQFAFKPHPHLYRALCQHPDWGKEKTDAFYRQWAEMPNTQLEEGPYTALFMQSDALVHDSGSFILEYLFADKPALFLRAGEGYANYNEMTLDALKSYHIGLNKAEIDYFLHRCVLGTDDPLAEVRQQMRRRYILPPNGKKAAQNIIDALLHAC